ncbi:MAG: hypothetical protein KatS3mg009_1994 [Acidimicrobiia bacterium]|nr:MAG: hypothetical protein KatS3mg009_1994 [Acidimicrobiia bacterium]
MAEPEVALVFTPEPWVEELHRHLTDHGGALVRQVVVDPGVALEEHYDVLVASHRWPALTHAFVGDVHARGRAVLGVHDREEPAARAHLEALGVDDTIASDAGPAEFVAALGALRAARAGGRAPEPARPDPGRGRAGRVVVVGGPPGSGRTELAVHLAAAAGGVLVDADDVAPSVAQRLGLPVEPNLRTAIEAAEHGRGTVGECVARPRRGRPHVLAGLPNPGAWSQVRPGEVLRVVEALAAVYHDVVVDVAGSLDGSDAATTARGRHGLARALVLEADALVGVCAATPVGVTRLLSWAVDAVALAPAGPLVVAVNRAPRERFRRGELFEEITRSLPAAEVVFVPDDPRVAAAAWDGTLVGKGPFARAVSSLAHVLADLPGRAAAAPEPVAAAALEEVG